MSDVSDASFLAALKGRAEALSRSLDHAGLIAQKLGEWVKANYPERVSTAYWLVVLRADDGDPTKPDKGFEFRIYERPLDWWRSAALRVGGLVGAWSTGLAVSLRVAQFGAAAGEHHAEAWVGLAAVAPYESLAGASARKLYPALVASFRF